MVSKTSVLMAVALLTLGTLAETWYDPATGYTWTYSVTDGKASVGNGRDCAVSPEPSGELEIPMALGGSPVTAIGDFAFYECGGLASVAMPKGVISVGDFAFDSCSGLTSVVMPTGMTRIGNSAFAHCEDLTSVTIPPGVTYVGWESFNSCDSLTSVAIPSSVTYIGNSAFDDLIREIQVAEGDVDRVRDLLEAECSLDMSRVTFVQTPVSEVAVGPDGRRWSYRVVDGDAEIVANEDVKGDFVGDVVFPEALDGHLVMSVGEAAFASCSNLTSVAMHDGIRRLDSGVFCDCVALTNAVLPSGIREIDVEAFCYCLSLASIEIPEGVTNIDSWAFELCENLESVNIPASVEWIGYDAFGGCPALGAGVVVVDDCVLCVNGACPPEVVLPPGCRIISGGVFEDLAGLSSITIPSSMRNIGYDVFTGCSGLTKVTFEGAPPDGVDHAGLPRDVELRYNSAYAAKWLPVIAACGFTNAQPYEGGSIEPGPDPEPDPTPMPAPEPTPGPEPSPSPEPEPVPEPTPVPDAAPTPLYPGANDVLAGVGVPYAAAAAVYDGYLRRGDAPVGSIQVKVAKIAKGAAKVTATVQLGATKLSFKGGTADVEGNVSAMSAGGHTLAITLGRNGLSGWLDGVYAIDGARSHFTSRNKDEQAAADAFGRRFLGTANIILPDGRGVLAVTIAAKGKVKVAGTVAGTKVSATSQLLIGADACAIPVVITKKAELAFVLWMNETGAMTVDGVKGTIVGKAGRLKEGATLRLDAQDLAKALPGLYADYLPDGHPVIQAGAKWVVVGSAKAGRVVLDRKTGEIDVAKLGANPSGLKLAYTAKTGAFKGSFKAYALEKGRIKAYTVNVEGVMVGGRGYGTAMLKKPAVSCPVAIE